MNKISLEEFKELYEKSFGKSEQDDIRNSYASWIGYQKLRESKTEKEIKKDKFVIWNNFPTAELWIEEQVKEKDRKIASIEYMKSFEKLPWYEKVLISSPIKDSLIEAFINNEEGKKIRKSLLMWNIPAEILFPAIKHFATSIANYSDMDEEEIEILLENKDDEINEFIQENKEFLDGWGIGVAVDGERVFRTICIACELYYSKYLKA